MNIINDKFTRDWIEHQVYFRYHKYCWIAEKTWQDMGSLLTIRDVLTIEDTVESMKQKDFPEWKEDRYLMHLNKIKEWNSYKEYTKDHIFPFRFCDNAGHKKPMLGHNMVIGGYGMLCTVDDVYKRYSSGANDEQDFQDKINKVQFLGSFTGPFASSAYKTSRVEIISKWAKETSWADLAFIEKPSSVVNRPEYEEFLKPLIKPQIPLKDNMKFKYILCIEGNDVSSSFSWALASNCLPLHPYPFISATYFTNGLQPYKHFIPLKRDASDLKEAFEWCQANQELCTEIVKNGKEHMKPFQDKELNNNIEKEFAKKWDLQIKHLKKIP